MEQSNKPTQKTELYNPALYQEPRYEPAPVIPLLRDVSLLDWLESVNRLIYREQKEVEVETEGEREIEIEGLTDESEDEYRGFGSDDNNTVDEPEEI